MKKIEQGFKSKSAQSKKGKGFCFYQLKKIFIIYWQYILLANQNLWNTWNLKFQKLLLGLKRKTNFY